jgi:hypothetical protein
VTKFPQNFSVFRALNFTMLFLSNPQSHLESSNFIGGYQNITNYFARHTPTQREYALRDVRLSFYVSPC